MRFHKSACLYQRSDIQQSKDGISEFIPDERRRQAHTYTYTLEHTKKNTRKTSRSNFCFHIQINTGILNIFILYDEGIFVLRLRKVKKMDTSKCILSIGFIQNTFTGFLHSKDLKRQRHCKYYPIRFPCVHFPHKCCRNTRNLAWLTCRVSREPCTVDRSRPISRRSFCLLSIAILFCKFSSRLARASELKSYDYDVTSTRGPSQWGSLDESYSLCSQGKLQSPIVLTKSNATVENVSQSPFRLTSRHSKFFARQEPSLQDIIVIQQSFPPPSMEGDASLIDQK